MPGTIQTTSHQHSEAATAARVPVAAAKILVVAALVGSGMDFLEVAAAEPVVAAKTSEVAVVALANQMDRLPSVAAKMFVAEVEQVQTGTGHWPVVAAVARTFVGSAVAAVLVVAAMLFVAAAVEPG